MIPLFTTRRIFFCIHCKNHVSVLIGILLLFIYSSISFWSTINILLFLFVLQLPLLRCETITKNFHKTATLFFFYFISFHFSYYFQMISCCEIKNITKSLLRTSNSQKKQGKKTYKLKIKLQNVR